ncbi:MAG: polysaccharide deacetylase family protein [Pseudomonadota bacterium]
MLKALVKSGFAQAARWTGQLRARENRRCGFLSILCFHRILPEAQRQTYFNPVLAITPEAFEIICSTLKQRAEVLPVAEAVAAFREGAPRAHLVAFSFDDGYQDNLQFAAPILAAHELRASFYVVADLIGKPQPPWYDRLGRIVQELARNGQPVDARGHGLEPGRRGAAPSAVVGAAKELGPDSRRALLDDLESRLAQPPVFDAPDRIMDWKDLRSLSKTGHEIGSHSRRHEILPQLDDVRLREEIQDSKRILERGLGSPVRSFCFPNGDYDARCLNEVEAAGYEAALTTRSGSNPPGTPLYELRRHFVHQRAWSAPSGRLSPVWVRLVVAGLWDRN